jgi:tetratricopeptide (TPR) repeat protein
LEPKRLSRDAEAWLQGYSWPGNVRELSHLLERVTLLSTAAVVSASTLVELCLPRLQPAVRAGATPPQGEAELLDEAARIRQALGQTGGNVVRAAQLTGISRGVMRYRMRQYGIGRPCFPMSTPLRGKDTGAGAALGVPPNSALLRQRSKAGEGQHPGEGRAAEAWEQKPVAVLAIDVAWPEAVELPTLPAEPWTWARRWQQTIAAKVQGFGGLHLQHTPSPLIAVFGLPQTLEQLPQRAVQVALAIRYQLVADRVLDSSPPGPAVRMAVHVGQVLVDVQAHDPTAELLPLGETLSLPVRLLGHAALGKILLSPQVRRQVEGWFALQVREGAAGAGGADGVGAYAVVGVGLRRSPVEVYGKRPLSRFVGRERELAMLGEVLAQVATGHGQVVGLVGEPGVGKSRLVDSLPSARILLLVNYRPEYQHGWGSKTSYTQLRLDPAPPASADEFLHALLGDDPSLAPLKQLLIARTEGNPFFLEESVRTLVETGVLVGEPGAYRLVQAVPTMQVPATVQAVLAARIDRLPPEEKRLLQTAAVIGNEVPLPLLQAIADVPEDALHRNLAHLQAAEFLYEIPLFPEPEYTFTHALTHEVAYGSLLQARRRGLHARIVEALEVLAPDRGAEPVERLAHHALRGEVWDKAITYCQQAGARAYDRAAFREAVAAFEQALQALEHLPESGDTRVWALEFLLALGDALHQLGEYGRRLALLGEAEARARALDDRVWLGRVLTRMAQGLRITGNLDDAIAMGRQALELAAEIGDCALQGEASLTLGWAYYAIGDFGRATELLRRNVEAADREAGTPNIYLRISSQAWLARTLGALGAFTEGQRHGEEALRLATLAGRGQTPILVHGFLSELYLAQGDLEHAVRVLEPGLALCRASGNRNLLPVIVAGLGYASALQGRLAAGRALRQLGTVHAHADPPDTAQAEAFYQQALALAEELGMRPLQAHCHQSLGILYAKTSRPEQAQAELTAAIDLYRAMDMTFWLPQAATALAQVSAVE